MRKEDLLEAMSYIDEDYIMEARESGRQKRRHVFGTVAAALALSIILPNVSPGTAMAMANICLLYTSPSPRDGLLSRMPSSA